MAGAGYKLFATGDVLTAAQVNTYLMQQTVMVFASSAARTTALSGVLAEGMVSYLQDTNTLEVYDGAAWVGATGDITGLTAGTGISISSATGPVPTVAIDTAVTADLTTAQTLTNKTLTSPVLTTPSISNIEAKGDILVGTADNTLGIIAAGSNGDTLVADSSTSTGLRYNINQSAGKNKVLNGAFDIWQRGTTVSNPNGAFLADRFLISNLTAVPTSTYSQQTFTPGTAPVAGYEAQYFMRFQVTAQGSSTGQAVNQRIEDVRTFAGQTVTFSFWAKAAANLTMNDIKIGQNFGSGGSSATETNFTMSSKAVTTSWQRFTGTATVPSISGKTVGSSSYIYLYLEILSSQGAYTFDTWGWQLEAGSVATAFSTATGTIQGELAACQRYYYRNTIGAAAGAVSGYAFLASTTRADSSIQFPVSMRIAPSTFEFSGLRLRNSAGATTNVSAVGGGATALSTVGGTLSFTVGSTTSGTVGYVETDSSTSYLGISAEL